MSIYAIFEMTFENGSHLFNKKFNQWQNHMEPQKSPFPELTWVLFSFALKLDLCFIVSILVVVVLACAIHSMILCLDLLSRSS